LFQWIRERRARGFYQWWKVLVPLFSLTLSVFVWLLSVSSPSRSFLSLLLSRHGGWIRSSGFGFALATGWVNDGSANRRCAKCTAVRFLRRIPPVSFLILVVRICFFNHFSPVPSSVELFFRAVRRIIWLPPLELSAAAVAVSTTNVDESPPISAVGPFYFRNRIYKFLMCLLAASFTTTRVRPSQTKYFITFPPVFHRLSMGQTFWGSFPLSLSQLFATYLVRCVVYFFGRNSTRRPISTCAPFGCGVLSRASSSYNSRAELE
jgi:hypothetical protein